MKRSKIFSFLLIGLVCVAATTGCKKNKTGVTPIPGRGGNSNVSIGRPSGPMDLGGRTGNEDAGIGVLDAEGSTPTGAPASDRRINEGPEDRVALGNATIYFDLDQSTVKSGEREKLQQVATYLQSNPTHDIMIEGHCDERGTEGYNQSLGEKRALATREALIELGAPANSLYTTSYGESKPAVQGGGEDAWAKNRRAEFVVVLPAQ